MKYVNSRSIDDEEEGDQFYSYYIFLPSCHEQKASCNILVHLLP